MTQPKTNEDFEMILTSDPDGGFVATCPQIPGCISQGDTEDEARANLREAIDLCREADTMAPTGRAEGQ